MLCALGKVYKRSDSPAVRGSKSEPGWIELNCWIRTEFFFMKPDRTKGITSLNWDRIDPKFKFLERTGLSHKANFILLYRTRPDCGPVHQRPDRVEHQVKYIESYKLWKTFPIANGPKECNIFNTAKCRHCSRRI